MIGNKILGTNLEYDTVCSIMPAKSSKDQKQHCWECRRRYLVCDSTKPACTRCSASNIVCPGYGHAKPARLRWLAPGTVNSRRRKPKDKDLGDRGTFQVPETSLVPHSMPTTSIHVPYFDINIDACPLLAQAANYCKCLPIIHTIVVKTTG